MTDTLNTIAQLSGLVFVVGSMLAMGLSLTVPQIIQPLKNKRLVILALIANFVIVPALAYGITALIPIGEGQRIGLILLATAAGAPFLPKLAQAAKGDMAFSVGLMVLLMVVTVIYLPIVLPLLLTGVEVNPWDIAQSLIVTMLIPLEIRLPIGRTEQGYKSGLGFRHRAAQYRRSDSRRSAKFRRSRCVDHDYCHCYSGFVYFNAIRRRIG